MKIRMLTAEDAVQYRELRLEALQNHPTAFSTDVSEEAALTVEDFQSRLTPGDAAVSFGAYIDDRLIGIATLLRSQRLRQRFRATIAAMYVAPAFRGQGIAKALIAHCIEHARGLTGVEEVSLCVTVGNEPARKSYLACGFKPEFVDPRYFKYEDCYYDLEWLRFPLEKC